MVGVCSALELCRMIAGLLESCHVVHLQITEKVIVQHFTALFHAVGFQVHYYLIIC